MAARRSSSPTPCTPTPRALVIATKGGLRAGGHPDGRPERLRSDCEDSLRRLRVDTIDLWQLHRIDPDVPFEEQFGAIGELRDEGKIRFVGVSEVSLDELRRAQSLIEIATVQNRYNPTERQSDDVLAVCEADGIGFMPWAPIRVGETVHRRPGGARLAAGPLARHAADPGHRVDRAPARERRRRAAPQSVSASPNAGNSAAPNVVISAICPSTTRSTSILKALNVVSPGGRR